MRNSVGFTNPSPGEYKKLREIENEIKKWMRILEIESNAWYRKGSDDEEYMFTIYEKEDSEYDLIVSKVESERGFCREEWEKKYL